jgi:hypothetical protein
MIHRRHKGLCDPLSYYDSPNTSEDGRLISNKYNPSIASRVLLHVLALELLRLSK